MTISKKLMKMLKKCNKRKEFENSSNGKSDTCLHYKIDTIQQIKKILNDCKRNKDLCKWTTYHFPKSFLLVIHIADNEISVYIEEYLKKKYNINPDDIIIVDLFEIYKLNIEMLQKVIKPKDPLFYDIYIKYSEFMDQLNNLILDTSKLKSMEINDLEDMVNNYIHHANQICSHILSTDPDLCENCICNNLHNV
jgi:hypothetical protein